MTLGLFPEFPDAALGRGAHQSEILGLGGIDRQGSHGQLGAGFDVMLHELAVIHSVQLITGEDQVVVDIPLLKQPLIFAHRIGRALEPARAVRGLLGGKHLHKTLTEAGREVVAHRQMTVERGAVELG